MESLINKAYLLQSYASSIRQDLHKYPETGFLEYRTSSFIIKTLLSLGYDVKYGKEVMDGKYILSLPEKEKQEECINRAILEGADVNLVNNMKDGMTGIVATIDTNKKGNTIAFRFDMDANDVSETTDINHLPNNKNFASTHKEAMHACGHDGHVAIGLSLAKLIKENIDKFSGKIKLIFQPAEEGVRGANSMVNAGVVDDVNYLFSGHIGIKAKDNDTLVCFTSNFLATSRYEVNFKGISSHAALAPEKGKNALLAAASATLSLHTLAQHGQGVARVNVGILNAGSGHNVVADTANLVFQTRGESNIINEDIERKALQVIEGAAKMYDVSVNYQKIGYASAIDFDSSFSKELATYFDKINIYNNIIENEKMDASEDCTLFMKKVLENNGKAAYMMFGSKIVNEHHNSMFDFDESVLSKAIAIYACLAYKYSNI